ncbi:MAG: MazG nucleotide pyrophosphohydrolase domain-containing protein [Candidatus Muiribacteriaceae bacterium]
MKNIHQTIERLYGDRDRDRDLYKNIAWLTEELGELVQAIRKGSREEEEEEFADVLAWLVSLANVREVDLEHVFYRKYGEECVKCGHSPCKCP